MSLVFADRFELGALIGQGGMGEVYAGRDLVSGAPVAIKALRPDFGASPEVVQRFQREGEALRLLNHPNIIRLIATLSVNGRHYLVMEYVPNGSLADLLARVRQLPIARTLELALDLSDALARVHRLGILHRDIKPANVLLAADGTPRLTDFGIAHFGDQSPLTRDGSLLGTYAYMCPEAFQSSNVGPSGDVWSFGVLLFECLVGSRPFTGANPAALIAAILTQSPPDLRALRPETPPALAEYVAAMLERDPSRRPRSVRPIGALAEALLRGEPPPPVAGRATESMATTGGVGSLGDGGPSALAPGGVGSLGDGGPSAPAPARADSAPAASAAQQIAAPAPLETHSPLPLTGTPLVGRDCELAEVRARLLSPEVRLLVLTGPGGVGKTRLSIAAASSVAAEFPGGLQFVDLSALKDDTLVAPAIARALAIHFENDLAAAERLAEELRPRRLLLILDNFEQVVAAAPLLSALLAAARELKILVTSRSVLRIAAEHEYQVPPLAVPDLGRLPPPAELAALPSVALFLQRARTVSPGFTLADEIAPAVAAICVRLDGLPLAIELAAARCKVVSPQSMLGRLESRLKLLTGGPRDSAARQQTLRATIDWSYELLTPAEAALFARLAVFVGGAELEAVEAVGEDDAGAIDVLDGLGSLIDKSLLRQRTSPAGEARFAMLETVHEYAAERLAAGGEARAAHLAHLRYYLRLAELAEPELTGPAQERWLARLECEHGNLRAALAWALDAGEGGYAMRLAGAIWRFWYTHGHLSEGRRWLGLSLGQAAEVAPACHAKALSAAGGLAWAQGDYEAARGWLEAALPLLEQAGDQAGLARALNILGVVARSRRDYPEACRRYGECLALARSLGDRRSEAYALGNLGVVLQHQGDLAGAEANYRQSLAISRALGDQRGVAVTLGNLGEVARLQGNYEAAQTWYLESLGLCRTLGDREGLTVAFESLADLACAQRQPLRAARLWGAAEALRDEIAVPLPPAERASYEAAVAQARAVAPDAFAQAWALGRMLSSEQAVAEAISLTRAV